MARTGRLKIATCQMTVSGQIAANAERIAGQVDQAARMKADAAHFPECALSGYAGTDFESWEDFDWDELAGETRALCRHIARRKLWVILGTAHRLTGENLPHNSLYLIAPDGTIADRYDKRFCTGGDLKFYTPGDHFSFFEIGGVRCGMLICFDLRFPELYRQYKRRDVEVVFHSFYNARQTGPGIRTEIMPCTVRARAASNYIWVSACNACGHYQEWPSFISQPDGMVAATLTRHRPGVAVAEINTSESFYDASGVYRNRAMKGLLNSAPSVRDKRSRDRRSL